MIAGVGAQFPQPDPRGWLVFESLPTDLQRLEDSRLQADFEDAEEHRGWPWMRPATDTERALLEHLGYTLPATLTTRVDYDTGIRCRRWPDLEGQTP
ncbi:hypothetical protein C5E45_28285 [Nocardia nova]|uniref:Uncharacterized protein n=1 Tax=Nocardia nova TaxID=37330 RepID=A0A2S6AI69_9NOCA|nr:hypothetical protein [Nocardia nova]PPJ24148.1 hypothetical protein C5E41_22875 [Nocardia nova]PPJ34918.1 hypothetical protein C5E45_28285 [Nocardia nova]